MVLGTYANLFATEEAMSGSVAGPAKLGPVLAEVPPIVNLDQLPVHQDKLEPKGITVCCNDILGEFLIYHINSVQRKLFVKFLGKY